MSDKISYILEVLDGYSDNIKKFNDSLNSVGKSTKKFTEQEEKTRKARINYSKIQQEEWRQHKQWMHEERIGLSKTLFLKSNIAKTTKAASLAEKDNAIAGATNLKTLSQKQLLNKQAVNTLSRVKIQEERIFGNRIRATRMNVSSAMLAPSGAFTKVAFNNQLGKFESIEKTPKEFGVKYGVAGGLLGNGFGSMSSVASGLGFAGAAYTVGRSVKYVHDTTVQMDSLRASLSALIPNVKGLEKATAQSEIDYIKGVSNKYGLSFNDIAPSYVQMLGTGGKTDASLARGLVENIGGYGSLLGLKGPAIQDTMVAFQQMLTKQTLQAQEINLQTQQLPGIKPMLHEAFFRLAQKGGRKDITMQNASTEFIKSMATGKLSSDLMLRELIKVINEKFGKEMIEKSFKMQGEENRLSTAGQQLASTLGISTYDLQIGAIRGLTDAINQSVTSIKTITESFTIMDNAFGDSKLFKIVKGMAGGLKDVMVDGTGELIKAPFKTASMLGEVAVAGAMGEKELGRQAMRDWKNYYFSAPSMQNNAQQNNIPQKPQEVIVKITTENMPDFFSVQTSQPNMSMWRPSTVIAGQR